MRLEARAGVAIGAIKDGPHVPTFIVSVLLMHRQNTARRRPRMTDGAPTVLARHGAYTMRLYLSSYVQIRALKSPLPVASRRLAGLR